MAWRGGGVFLCGNLKRKQNNEMALVAKRRLRMIISDGKLRLAAAIQRLVWHAIRQRRLARRKQATQQQRR